MAENKEVDLTEREVEVLIWISEGWTNQQVAEKLGIGKKTVDFHLTKIYEKLGVTSRIQAFIKATGLGLLPSLPPHRPESPRQNQST